MSVSELAKAMGISKSRVYILIQHGMPTDSVESAIAWRQRRAARGCGTIKTPPTKSQHQHSDYNEMWQGVLRAREVERYASKLLSQYVASGKQETPEFCRLNAAYVTARQNRTQTERDFREWLHQQGITVYVEEARKMLLTPIEAVVQTLRVLPGRLAPQLVHRSANEIQSILAIEFDSLIRTLHNHFSEETQIGN